MTKHIKVFSLIRALHLKALSLEGNQDNKSILIISKKQSNDDDGYSVTHIAMLPTVPIPLVYIVQLPDFSIAFSRGSMN